MTGGQTVPVVSGLAVGVAFLVSITLGLQDQMADDKLTLAEREVVSEEITKLREINQFPRSINPQEYPVVVAAVASSNLTLIERYYCSDLCPEYARVVLIYGGISSVEECKEQEGVSLTDIAWGGYVGCAPLRCSDLDPDIQFERINELRKYDDVGLLAESHFSRVYGATNTIPVCHNDL
jgi:hypothetical protein